MISWTKPQVQARSHPNILAAAVWLNKLYHVQVADIGNNEKNLNGQSTNTSSVDLDIPLIYADRFRIRKPGTKWDFLEKPHVDGASHTLLTRQFVSPSGYS